MSKTIISYSRMCVCGSVWCLYLVFYLILLTLTKDTTAQELKSPAHDFSHHRVVRPTLYHAREKRELTTSRINSGTHHPEVTISINIDDKDYILDLRLNEDLVPDNHTVSYQNENGEAVLLKPTKDEIDLCQYFGTVRDKPGSWAAVSTCKGLRGVIYDGHSMKYIEPREGPNIQSEHFIYDHGDLVKENKCGYNGGITNKINYDKELYEKYNLKKISERINRFKRSTDESQVRGPFNSNRLSRYVELVLVADNGEYKANGENLQAIQHQLKDVANIINALYAPLNIYIALVGIVVWTNQDEIVLEENGDNTLTHFLKYRRQKLIKDIPNDNAQLLTSQQFNDGVVGKALKGPVCTYEFSGGVANNHSEVIGLVATTIAHEMGHNFGMEHDTEEDCDCPDEKCIMSPSSTSVTPIHWSSCSLKSLALAFERGMDYCLRNKPTRLFSSPTCGNGFVEPGEQCDCGLILSHKERSKCASCCDPDRCMLRSNATCATGACCDLQTCRPARAGTVCRSADQECDLPEFCTGYSEYCPDDVYKMDATSCDNNKAYCVSGSCRSHNDQCRLLWGSTGEKSHDECYAYNVNGSKSGNCGYDRVRVYFKPCSLSNALCGMLHCKHLNEKLEFGMESVSDLSHRFINNNGVIMPCRSAVIDLGLNPVDPSLVPDGAKCGDGKMCLKQECVFVSDVLETLSRREGAVCPSDCSKHGVCNSEGHCHCEPGFAPPLCDLPGPGGSVDSGPATDPSVQRNFMVAMYVIFLGIIPSIVTILLIFYYWKHNMVSWWKKPRKSMQSPKKTSIQQRLSRGASKFAANFQNNHPPSSAPQVNVHTLSSPDDMSSSLLRSDSEHSPSGNINPSVNFFGNFKGFSLTPIEKHSKEEEKTTIKKPDEKLDAMKSAKITPVHRSSSNSQNIINQGVLKPVLRTAPPLPVVPVSNQSPKTSPIIKRTNSTVQNKIKAFMANEKNENIQPVPSNAPIRPVISSPILEASTCTAKELISPLQGFKTLGPVRAAPNVPTVTPNLPKRPLSMHGNVGNVLQKPLPEEPKKVKEGISLNRIASFLRQEKPKEKERQPVERSHSLPKNPNNQVKVPKVDKVALRNLQISNPILQKEIDLPVHTVPLVSESEEVGDNKSFATRTQSMRAPIGNKPVIQSFGSMRQAPGVTRPVSTVGRPTAPPPPLPNQEKTPVYQNPKGLPKSTDIKPCDYVDCIEEKQAPLAHIDEEDNIYAVIEESPQKPSKALPGGVAPPIKTTPQAPPEGYIAPKPINSHSSSTESMGLLGEIVDEIQNRNFDSIYSGLTLTRKKKGRENQGAEKDKNSTYANTDSIYNSDTKSSAASTTSSGYLHPSAVNVPTYKKPEEKGEPAEKTPPSPTLKGPNSKIPTFTRQVTPPGLRATSSFRNVPSSPKNVQKPKPITANSPDVVSSCAIAEAKNVKPPDVINNNKVILNDSKKSDRPPLRPTPAVEKKPLVQNSAAKISAKVDTKNPSISKVKGDLTVKTIADNLNKNRPKVVPKPSNISVQRTDSSAKPSVSKFNSKSSNVANLQQKFENRKSVGKQTSSKK